jgi:hypothetical protein
MKRLRGWPLPALILTVASVSCGGDEDASARPGAATAEEGPPGNAAVASLIEQERAFASRSVEAGMKTAFLEYMDEDVVLFRPAPARGLSAVREAPELEGTLEWGPEQAEASEGGDLGYTTGPYRVLRDGEPVAHGHYLTVWTRERGADGGGWGPWRAILDGGITHGPVPSVSGVETPDGPGPPFPSADPDALLGTDRRLNEAGLREAGAYRDHAAERLRLHLDGETPVRGVDAAVVRLEALGSTPALASDGGDVSSDGSLGYTWGTIRSGTENPSEAGYLRVWRGGAGRWTLVAEVRTAGG